MKKIPLTQGKEALVDDEDYDWLTFREKGIGAWRVTTVGKSPNSKHIVQRLVTKEGKRSSQSMSREIWKYHYGDPGKLMVDHKNRDQFDNRKENFRLANHSQNHMNSVKPVFRQPGASPTSQYKGVVRIKKNLKKPWRAYYKQYGKIYNLGMFETEEGAAKAYDKAIKEARGEWAVLNFPDEKD